MEHIEIVANPEPRYIKEITKYLAEIEGWNRTLLECDVWRDGCDFFVFFIAIDRKNDCAAGSISMTMDKSLSDPDDDLYYIGSFYTAENYRGIGLGRILFHKALEVAGSKNINLNAVLSAEEMYAKKYGFVYSPSYYSMKIVIKTNQLKLKQIQPPEGVQVKNISEIDQNALFEYDRNIIERNRHRYLLKWCTCPDAVTKVAIDVNGKVVGISCLRKQMLPRVSFGPFYADSPKIAETLFHSTLLAYPNLSDLDVVHLRFPAVNTEVQRVVNEAVEGEVKASPYVKSQFNRRLIEPNPALIYSVFEAGHSIA